MLFVISYNSHEAGGGREREAYFILLMKYHGYQRNFSRPLPYSSKYADFSKLERFRLAKSFPPPKKVFTPSLCGAAVGCYDSPEYAQRFGARSTLYD